MLVLQGLLLNFDGALEAPVMVHFTVLHVEQVTPRVLSVVLFPDRSLIGLGRGGLGSQITKIPRRACTPSQSLGGKLQI